MTAKKALKAMIKNKFVYWNDPDGVANGEYKIIDIDEENNIAKIQDKYTTLEVDINELE